jgi:hypothetical protein
VKGYDLIADVKTELERRCPGVVSCSDIEILATRDAVRLAGGNAYTVRTGRRDRRQSKAADVNLPVPESTVAQATAFFGKLGLSQMDMVLLLGAHTVGVTRCSAIKSARLYSYGGKAGATDPGLDPYYAFVYKTYVCPNRQQAVVGRQRRVPGRPVERAQGGQQLLQDVAETPRRALRRPEPLRPWLLHQVDGRHARQHG